MADIPYASEIQSFVMIVIIDLVMSGDNAIIIGMAAANLPPHLRRRAIVFGVVGATVLRIVFAAMVVQLLAIIGLTLAGGLLLLWVCWRMWRELRQAHKAKQAGEAEAAGAAGPSAAKAMARMPATTLRRAFVNIIVADVSMSLDNVLAVAGAARDHVGMLVFGLVLSIALMAVAANYIARLLDRYHWIAYLGLAIVAYVAVDMIWRGSFEIHEELNNVLAAPQ